MPTLTKDEFIAAIEKMSVLELNELVKALEDKFGVSAAAPVAVAVGGGAVAAAAEEKTSFDVNLKGVPDSTRKIGVIKIVREITGLGLKEAKDLVDGAPKSIKTGVTKADADEILAKFKDSGAEVEVK